MTCTYPNCDCPISWGGEGPAPVTVCPREGIQRPPFPSVIDSSILAIIRSCHQKAYLEYVEHWKPKTPNVHLHAGGAFAKGLEAAREAFYVQGRPAAEAEAAGLGALLSAYGHFVCPPDSAKSAERTAGALEFYFDNYPLGDDGANPITLPGGKRGIEFSFAHPLPITHPESGDPILYVGRMDMIAEYANGVFVEDDKTTSSLGASWSRQWDLRSQFSGYCWGAREAGIRVDGVLVRGVSILKTKYDTQQAITYRPDWQMERWYKQTIRDITRFKAAWTEGYYDLNLDHSCSEYGGCAFRQICLLQQPDAFLNTYFERRIWDPVTRTETLISSSSETTENAMSTMEENVSVIP